MSVSFIFETLLIQVDKLRLFSTYTLDSIVLNGGNNHMSLDDEILTTTVLKRCKIHITN